MSFTSAVVPLRLAILARAGSFLGDEVAIVAIVLRAQGHGASGVTVAALLMGNLVPMVLLSAPAGRLLDQASNRVLITVAALAQAAVCVVLAPVSSLAVTLVGVVLLGAGQAVTGAGLQTLVAAFAPPDGLARAMSRQQAATTVAGIAAPGLGGVLVGTTGTAVPLLIDAASFVLVAAVGVLVGGLRRMSRKPHAGDGRADGGWKLVRESPILATTMGLLGLFCLLGSMVNVVEVFLVRDTLGASATWFGLIGSVWALGMLAGALATGRVAASTGQARVIIGCAVVVGLAILAMGLVPRVGWLLLTGVIGGIGNGAMNVAASSLVMGAARPDQRGRVSAVLSAVISGTQLAAYGLAALLTIGLGTREILLLAGALGMLAPLLTGRRLVRTISNERAQRPGRDGPVGGVRRTSRVADV